jgi:hypothetical protein
MDDGPTSVFNRIIHIPYHELRSVKISTFDHSLTEVAAGTAQYEQRVAMVYGDQ